MVLSLAYRTIYKYVILVTRFFDPEAHLEIYRRRLPHWRQAGVTYFVTFRLIDSLPKQKLTALNDEKARWLAFNPPPHNERQKDEYHSNFSGRVQTWLDVGHGKCVLAQPEIRRLVENALRFFNDQRYRLGEFVVMPNHVHALVEPLANHRLERILHSWKSFAAKEINAITASKGSIWHRESFDHIVRSPAQLARIEQYILYQAFIVVQVSSANPLKYRIRTDMHLTGLT